jgi:hypothetical protein
LAVTDAMRRVPAALTAAVIPRIRLMTPRYGPPTTTQSGMFPRARRPRPTERESVHVIGVW